MDDAVWLGRPDQGILADLFGSGPALHEARVLSLDIQWESREASFLVRHTEENQTLFLRLVLSGVRQADLSSQDNWLYGVIFRGLPEGGVRVEFEQGFGMSGMLEAEGVEAFLLGDDPIDFDGMDPDAFRLSIR